MRIRLLLERTAVLAAALLMSGCGERRSEAYGSSGSDGSASDADSSGANAAGAEAGDASTADANPGAGGTVGEAGGAGASSDGSTEAAGVTDAAADGHAPGSPAQLLGALGSWHLTLPTGPSNAATQINEPGLETYAGPYFKLASTLDRVQMIDLFGGARTSTGTAFARSELRQDYAGPGALTNKDWACMTSGHAMHVKQRVTLTPLHKPEMSIGQIHDASNDLLELRYIGPEDPSGVGTGDGMTDTGKIEVHFNNDTSFNGLDGAYRIGDVMNVDLASDGAGNMTVRYANVTRGTTQSASAPFYGSVSGGCYFKAGNYHQACTIQDINGNTNAACQGKTWPTGRFESDPFGESILELFELTAN